MFYSFTHPLLLEGRAINLALGVKSQENDLSDPVRSSGGTEYFSLKEPSTDTSNSLIE